MIERITVCGLGKLGACIAAVFAKSGFDVMGYDIDAQKVAKINAGKAPVPESGLDELISRVSRRLRATTNAAEALRGSDACIFITPTPSLPGGSFDSKQLKGAIVAIASEAPWDEIASHRKPSPYLFIVCSTVTPGTCRDEILPLLKDLIPVPFELVYAPQFIALGSVIRDLTHPDFILIGESSEAGGEAAETVYHHIVPGAPIKRMNLLEAELAKISLNCFVTMKISFANQLGLLAEALDADPRRILDAIALDRRIGHSALKFGMSYGGPCFVRDCRLFQYVARRAGTRAPLAAATDQVNDHAIASIVRKALMCKGNIGILGTAYKPGTPIDEESSGVRIRNLLVDSGRQVRTHDPMAPHSHELSEVLAFSSILIVATAWPEYETLAYDEEVILIDPMRVVQRRLVRAVQKQV